MGTPKDPNGIGGGKNLSAWPASRGPPGARRRQGERGGGAPLPPRQKGGRLPGRGGAPAGRGRVHAPPGGRCDRQPGLLASGAEHDFLAEGGAKGARGGGGENGRLIPAGGVLFVAGPAGYRVGGDGGRYYKGGAGVAPRPALPHKKGGPGRTPWGRLCGPPGPSYPGGPSQGNGERGAGEPKRCCGNGRPGARTGGGGGRRSGFFLFPPFWAGGPGGEKKGPWGGIPRGGSGDWKLDGGGTGAGAGTAGAPGN